MHWTRSFLRKIPVIEILLVFAGTAILTAIGILTGVSQVLAEMIESQDPYHGIADIGPALLFLSCGMGIVAVRRWRESEVERQRSDKTRLDLQHSEERYRSLIEVSPDPIVLADKGIIRYANPAAVAFFGASDEADLLGIEVVSRLPEEIRSEALQWIADVLETGESKEPIEYPLLRLDGTLVDAETAIVRTSYEDGWALQAVIRDISSRRAAEEAMTRYRALEENTQDIVFFSGPDGRIIDCNRAAVLQYGYTKDELLALTTLDLRAPGCDSPAGVQLAKEPGDIARFDTVHARKDGTLIELSVTAQRIALGGDEFVVSLCRDVTEKRKSERDLRDSERRYRGLIDLSPSPIAVLDSHAKIIFANSATLGLVRAQDPSDVIGHPIDLFVSPQIRRQLMNALKDAGRSDTTLSSEVVIRRLDGTSIETEIASGRTSFAGVEGIQIAIQDVSRLKDEATTLRRTTEDTIAAMARLAETRDPYTSGHQERVAAIAVRIGRQMGLDDSTCETIRLSGMIHDIGKMNVPAEILSKPGSLSDAEFSLIKDHVERGYEVLRPIDFPWPIADIVRQHHERLDGSGYPHGLRGDEIRLEASVLAVADTVEAISSHRPYRPALGIDFAMTVITEGRGTVYDSRCVDAALELAKRGSLLESHAHGSAGAVKTAAV